MNNVDRFAAITKEMAEIYKNKNHDYGNSFDDTCDKFGIIAAVVRMYDKLNRLATLSKNNENRVNESISDTLIDLANYAIMTVIWMENGKDK